MTTYSQVVIGVFEHQSEARKAVDALLNAGFRRDQIGIALREGRAVTGSLLNDLVKLGIPQDRAGYYDSEYRAGHSIVTVRAGGREREAVSMLRKLGAHDFETQDQTATAQSAMATGAAQTGAYEADYAKERLYTDKEQLSMPIREEVLQAEKESVQTGEVRLRKEVVTEKKSIDVPVSHEEVIVERHFVEGAQVSDIPVGQGETIRIPVSEEQVEVTKKPIVSGEVSIGKRTVEETMHVADTVQREEPRLEKEGEPRIRVDDDTQTKHNP